MKARFKSYCQLCTLVATGVAGDVYAHGNHAVLIRFSDNPADCACYDISSVEDEAAGFKTVQDFAPGKPLAIAALEVIRLRMPSVWHNLFEKEGATAGREAAAPAYDPAGYRRLAVITQWLAGGKDVQIRRTGEAAKSFGAGWIPFDGRCKVEALLDDGIEFRMNPEVAQP